MNVFKQLGRAVESRFVANRCRAIAADYDFCGFKRIYLVHIRKTAGTSLNHMFFALSGDETPAFYQRLAAGAAYRPLIRDRKIYVGWNTNLIKEGRFFYGFSHTPLHELELPPRTFTYTCFRDPVERVVSHYRMLMDFQSNNVPHPCMSVEGGWLGKTFSDFLKRIPREHLMNQLYMFSKNCEIDEAVDRAGSLSHYMFTDDFDAGVERLNKMTGIALKPIHIRKSRFRTSLSPNDIDHLREELSDEYTFLKRVRRIEHNEAQDKP